MVVAVNPAPDWHEFDALLNSTLLELMVISIWNYGHLG